MVLVTFPQIFEFMNTISEKLKKSSLPFRTSYAISKIISQCKDETERYQTLFNQVLKDYAEVDENGSYIFLDDGNSIKIKEDKLEECQKKLSEMRAFQVEFPIGLKEDDLESLTLTPVEVDALAPFIE